MKKCNTPYCRNKTKRKKCSSCTTREWRTKNPERAAYLNLKSNSKRRGKEFTLTFEYFLEFGIKTNYFTGKGRSKHSYTIDRIDDTKGYTDDTIQVLELSDNVKKKGIDKRLHYDWEHKYATVSTTKPLTKQEEDDLPF